MRSTPLAGLALLAVSSSVATQPQDVSYGWFCAPAKVATFAQAPSPGAKYGIAARYVHDDSVIDVFVYDPTLVGIARSDDATMLGEEARVFRDALNDARQQGMYDAIEMGADDPLTLVASGHAVQGTLISGAAARQGRFVATHAVLLAVRGARIKLRGSGPVLTRNEMVWFAEALLREAVRWE